MAKIKLTTVGRVFIPNVAFDTDEGIINNRDMDSDDQVSCDIKLASINEKASYIENYTVTSKKQESKTKTNMKYNLCVKKHCAKIKGLEDYGITSGSLLVDCATKEPRPELNDIILELFLKINGVHTDDSKASDGGEFSEGE